MTQLNTLEPCLFVKYSNFLANHYKKFYYKSIDHYYLSMVFKSENIQDINYGKKTNRIALNLNWLI